MVQLKIGFCGTHSTGKTTLAKFVSDTFAISYKGNISRSLHVQGVKINEDGNDYTQMRIFSEHVRILMSDTSSVTDRTLIDAYAYTLHNYEKRKISYEMCRVAELILNSYIQKYTLIIYQPLQNIPMKEDGVRKIDEEFRIDIDTKIKKIIKDKNIAVIVNNKSIPEQENFIKDVIKKQGDGCETLNIKNRTI